MRATGVRCFALAFLILATVGAERGGALLAIGCLAIVGILLTGREGAR